jgi:cytochrome c oxidase assembly protein subunit 15
MTETSRRQVALWLFVLCGMVFAMVVLGGVTRLTESGLSIVDWNPVIGALPPLSDAEWQATFERYKSSPEFQKLNFWMSLADFKTIFWFEYFHRLWGRVIGAAFLIPFVYFAAMRKLDRPALFRLGGAFVLGGLQGLLGWWMVKSGLVDRPEVSQYRLAAHLALALVIYAYMFWIALDLIRPGWASRAAAPAALPRLLTGIVAWVSVVIVSGAFVAGLDAGHAYNTFPLMGGQIVPPGYLDLSPWYLNAFENVAAVQFHHRVLATGLVLFILGAVAWAWRRGLGGPARRLVLWLALAAVLQLCLGIATLLTYVEISVAATHQAGAVVVLTLALWALHAVRRGAPETAVRGGRRADASMLDGGRAVRY